MNLRRFLPLMSACAVLLPLGVGCARQPATDTSAAARFMLTSPGLMDGATVPPAQVYNGNGCGGQNVSPALHWAGFPAQTQSFAITVFDPDAGSGRGWWHWAAYNLPVRTVSLDAGSGGEGKLPEGAVQAQNDFGNVGYGGPCPPQGDTPHHYVFTIYALDVPRLAVSDATAASVDAAARLHALGKATLTVRYGR